MGIHRLRGMAEAHIAWGFLAVLAAPIARSCWACSPATCSELCLKPGIGFLQGASSLLASYVLNATDGDKVPRMLTHSAKNEVSFNLAEI